MAAERLSISYFVAGAMARDLVLFHVFGHEIQQATRDIDLAVHVSGWDQFELLTSRLVESGKFTIPSRAAQRLRHVSGYPVDLLPFGGVEGSQQTITWPPTRDTVMNVIGYPQALQHALTVEVTTGVIAPVASLASLAVPKMFAWMDRGSADRKDALDVALILRRYGETLGTEMLHADGAAVLEAVGFDYERAGARMLGQHARAVVGEPTAARLLAHLEDAAIRDRLTIHVAAGYTHTTDQLRLAEQLLDEFCAGLSGAPSPG